MKGEAEGVRIGVGVPGLRMFIVDEGIALDRSATRSSEYYSMRDSSTVDSSCGTFRSLLAHDHDNGQRSQLMKTQDFPNEIRTFLYTVT
jgi:hypothetical protein